MGECIQGLLQKIKEELFSTVDICTHVSASAYDTAWLAMIPHAEDPSRPMFPQCLEWILHNQKQGGFWGDELTIDFIPSTLACMVALKTWDVGLDNIHKGLDFMHGHMEKLLLGVQGNTPRWFAVVFPGMLEHAWSKHLELFPQGLPHVLKSTFIERQRILETKEVAIHAYRPPLIYYYEALPSTYKMENCMEVVPHLSADGSLFQSPSATASAFMDTKDKRCQDYLESMVQRCGFSVPPIYPIDEELIKLCVVDRLERLGLDEHFQDEIDEVLHDVYRNWMERQAKPNGAYISPIQIYKDCVAYRLLTLHGYCVSPSTFSALLDHESLVSYLHKNHDNFLSSLLNVYRASELLFFGKGQPQNLNSYSRILLEKEISQGNTNVATNLRKEIARELDFPWLTRVDHLEHRECIEQGEASDIWTGKAWFKISCLNSMLLALAKENFAYRQNIYRSELKELKGWVRDTGISGLGFGREKTDYCYFAIATTAYHASLLAVRMTGSKQGILLTIIDDFFDVQGSMDEITRFTDAVERWDGERLNGVGKVLFNALNDLINDTAMQAFLIQGRDVIEHLRDIWCQVIRSWLQEAEWSKKNYTPSIDEYLRVAAISTAVQTTVLPSLYLVGPIISEEMIHHPDYVKIIELLMVSARLLNDLQSYQKESKEGKPNLVMLFMQRQPEWKIADAKTYIAEMMLDRTRKELLEHALINDKNCVPKSCRKIHLIALKIFQMFYNSTNRYDCPTAMIQDINKAIYEPLCK